MQFGFQSEVSQRSNKGRDEFTEKSDESVGSSFSLSGHFIIQVMNFTLGIKLVMLVMKTFAHE